MPRFCVTVDSSPQSRQVCGSKGVATLPDVAPGTWDVSVGGSATHFPAENRPVTVRRGKTSRVAFTLRPGDVADRFAATYTQVDAGGTATVDAALVEGATIAGTITGADGPIEGAAITADNRTTGDQAAYGYVSSDRAGRFTLRGLRTQDVWLSYPAAGRVCRVAVAVTAGETTGVALDTTDSCATGPEGLGRSSDLATRFRGLPSGS